MKKDLPPPTEPSPPVLSSLCTILSVITVLLAIVIFAIVASQKLDPLGVMFALMALLGAALIYGIGQAVTFLSQSAHYSRLTCQATIAIANRPIPTLETKAIGLPPLPGEETYHVRIESEVQGPFTRSQIGVMQQRGLVDDKTYIIREGESTWRQVADLAAHA